MYEYNIFSFAKTSVGNDTVVFTIVNKSNVKGILTAKTALVATGIEEENCFRNF